MLSTTSASSYFKPNTLWKLGACAILGNKIQGVQLHHIGVDIIEVGRLRQALQRWGERFLQRVYTEGELQACQSRLPELAARFAAKEAVMKALGTGRHGVGWLEVEVVSGPRVRPHVLLRGRAVGRAQELGVAEIGVSLSHTREWGLAMVVCGHTTPEAAL